MQFVKQLPRLAPDVGGLSEINGGRPRFCGKRERQREIGYDPKVAKGA